MATKELLAEINKLSVDERIELIEDALRSIRATTQNRRMEEAVDLLLADYQNDKELTAFSSLDGEDFYEAR